MTISLQFVTEKGVGSTLIRWGTHSDFSHVDAVLHGGPLLGARSDTKMPGVSIRAPDYAPFTRRQTVVIPTQADMAFYSFLMDQLGKPYDWKAIVGFAVDRNWRDPDSWFCSELVAAALEAAKIVKVQTPANRISPNDVFLLAASISSSIY
jgi:uncharacterized protein YycO